MRISEIVRTAFVIGHSEPDPEGPWASVVQVGPMQSLVVMEGEDDVIYEAVLDVRDLSFSIGEEPLTLQAQAAHKAVLSYIQRIKNVRLEKTMLNNVGQCSNIELGGK